MEQLKGHKNRQQEIITINIGGCGVNLGQTINEQYCVERGISCAGEKQQKTQYDPTTPISFEETTTGKYLARTLMIDLDPYSINNLKNIYKYVNLFRGQLLISGTSDACNNFAVAQLESREIIHRITEAIRISTESCDQLQGFIIHQSMSGGTGSGLSSLLLQQLTTDYQKKSNVTMQLFHDENKLSHPAQVYNALLNTHSTLQSECMSIVMDNKQMDSLCRSKLNIETPRYQHYNHLLTKLISSVTAPSRYGLNERLDSMMRDLITQPRLRFMTASMSPVISSIKMYKNDVRTLSSECLNCKNFFVSAPDYNIKKDKMIKLKMNYRGLNIKDDAITANDTIATLANKEYAFCGDDTPSLKFVNGTVPKIPLDDMMKTEKQVTMIANNVWICRLFRERVVKYFDVLYRQKSYVHWYVGNGMEEGLFSEAHEDVVQLEKEYLDVLSKQKLNESDDSDESDLSEDSDDSSR